MIFLVWRGSHEVTDKELFINCGGEQVDVDGKTYYADVNPNGASMFFINKTGGWGYSSMGFTKSVSDEPLPFIIKDTRRLEHQVLLGTARVAPISLKYYGFCFLKGVYILKLHFVEMGLRKNKGSPLGPRRVFDVDIQGKNVLKNFNIEEGQLNDYGFILSQYNVLIESHLEIHLYWSGNGSTVYPQNYGPLIAAISVEPVPKQHLSIALKAGIAGSSLVFLTLLLLVLWKLGYLGGQRSSKEVHSSTDEIALNKAVAALSQPSQSESYSTPGPSEATPSCSNSNNNIANEI
ncbi:putative leucine-rich repeat receptor-like protein kinase PXL2-like [Capsicum annuum]|nr:putative leucine-rich repeat receptor-like protein kinase PXL2-like [Capsicum annuum]